MTITRSSTAPGGWWLPIVLVDGSLFVLMAFETGYAIHDRDSQDGDEGAKAAVELMKRQGITLSPPKP